MRIAGENYHLICGEDGKRLLETMAPLLSAEETRVITDDAKAYYKALRLAGIRADHVTWDAVLSHYLLDAEAGDHSLDGQLKKRYRTIFQQMLRKLILLGLRGLKRCMNRCFLSLQTQG